MSNDVSDFYYMVPEFYKTNSVHGLRACAKGEYGSLGSIGDVEDDISNSDEEVL